MAYLFNQLGILSYPAGTDEDALFEVALEAGAEDVINNDDGSIDVTTTPESFMNVKQSLADKKYVPEAADITMLASTSQSLDLDGAKSMIKLLDMLEDLDDTQKVYSNADIPEDIMAELEQG